MAKLLCLSAGALLVARSLNVTDVLFIVHAHFTLKSEMTVKSYTLGPVLLKISCFFFSEVPVSVGVNVVFKDSLSQKGDQGMQHKSVSVETPILESLW